MKGELIPDEIIIGLLNERLNQSDCQICGFVLDGYPKNLVQLNCMNDLKIQPTAIVVLDCPEDLMMERIESRMIDSATGKIYNKSNIPASNDIKSRLAKIPNESKDILQKR
jgi:adenylate kinase